MSSGLKESYLCGISLILAFFTEKQSSEGDVLEVKDITPKDWWQGKNKSGESGYFPCNHVKLIQ